MWLASGGTIYLLVIEEEWLLILQCGERSTLEAGAPTQQMFLLHKARIMQVMHTKSDVRYQRRVDGRPSFNTSHCAHASLRVTKWHSTIYTLEITYIL
jgi:hypothetical protein